MIIRQANVSDAGEILKYLNQVGRETDNLTFGEEGFPADEAEEAQHLERLSTMDGGVQFLAMEDGKIVGDAGLTRLPRRMRHRGDLGISVLRSYWNRGIGSALMQHIIDYARDHRYDMIELQVRKDNLAAIHLYKKFGFRTIGTFPGFFKIGDELIDFELMILKL